jgi:WD40 repeat protein
LGFVLLVLGAVALGLVWWRLSRDRRLAEGLPHAAGTGAGREAPHRAPLPADAPATRLFPAETWSWPDLAQVERVLNRQPFQHFVALGNVRWLDEGRTLITADRSGVLVWDVPSQRLLRRIPANGVNSNYVAVRPDGRELAVFDYEGQGLRLLAWPSLREERDIPRIVGTPEAAAYSPDGKFLVVSISHNVDLSSLRVFDCQSGQTLMRRMGRRVPAIAWDPASRFFAAGEARGTVIFLTPQGQLIRQGIRLDPADALQSLAISADGKRLAVCTTQSVSVYSVFDRRKSWSLPPQEPRPPGAQQWYNRVSFSADGSQVLARGHRRPGGASLWAYDARTGRELRERALTTSFSDIMELSPDGRVIAYEDRNYGLGLCHAATFEPIVVGRSAWDRNSFSGDRNFPVAVRPSPDGAHVLTVGGAAVTQWDLSTGEEQWSVRRPDWGRDAAWSPRSDWIALVRDGNADPGLESAAVEILDPASGLVVKTIALDDERGGPVLVLRDDSIAACGQHHAYLFTSSGERLWKTRLCDGPASLSDLAVDADGSTLAVVHKLDGGDQMPHSGYSQGSIFLLRAETGERLRELLCPTTPERVWFSFGSRKRRYVEKRVVATTNNHPRRRGALQPLLETWVADTGLREDIETIPDHPAFGEDFVEGGAERIQALLNDEPLAASNRVIVEGDCGVSADGRLVGIEKPIEPEEYARSGFPSWSGRLLLWEAWLEQPLETWVLPSGVWDAAMLPDGRMVTLNENGTVFVMRVD